MVSPQTKGNFAINAKNTPDKPIFCMTLSRITGKDETVKDILTRPKEIGTVGPRGAIRQERPVLNARDAPRLIYERLLCHDIVAAFYAVLCPEVLNRGNSNTGREVILLLTE